MNGDGGLHAGHLAEVRSFFKRRDRRLIKRFDGNRSYPTTVQQFADLVLADKYERGRTFAVAQLTDEYRRTLNQLGIHPEVDYIDISDHEIRKYVSHSKSIKGAVLPFEHMKLVERALKHPKGIYLDTKSNEVVFLITTPYNHDRVHTKKGKFLRFSRNKDDIVR